MNDTAQTSAPGSALLPNTTDLFTSAHLVIIALFAVLVVIGLLYGARLKHRRRQAERQVEEHAAEAGKTLTRVAPSAPVGTAAEPAAPPPPTPPSPPPPIEPIAADDPMASEPIAAAAPLEDNPAAQVASVDAGPAERPEDGPVTQLKGLGPKVAARLAELGITTVGQVAALSDDRAAELDAQLGSFRGRMQRDRWIEQARFLAAGDRAGFEAVFGKL